MDTARTELSKYTIGEHEKPNSDLTNHLPEMLCWMDIEKSDTSIIRNATGVLDPNKGSRIMRVMVMEKLNPLASLKGLEFMRCWLEIVHCMFTRFSLEDRDPALTLLC